MQPGTVLGQRYRILDRIGGGGMALVYRAEDTALGRPVALKVLRSQFAADPEFVRRFRREAQAAASLSHPNIVSIYDVGQEGEHHYIVMELVEGETLKSRIQRQGPLSVEETTRIGLEILAALEHAHSHKIVHRDIKPHNILLSRDGRVKVTDFGIARAVTTDTVTNTGSILGSAHYFSPEMAKGQGATEQSDLYSLGVVLYEMVTGRVPFQGESPITVALKHVQEEVLPPGVLNPQLPAELEAIILRALAKDPAQRFSSAAEMRQTLEQFLEDHRAGRTRLVDGDYPTLDLRAIRQRQHREPALAEADLEQDWEEDGVSRPVARRRRWGLYLLISFAALFLGGLAYGGYVLSRLLEVPEVPVPDVVGRSAQEAEQILRAAGLQMQVKGQEYSTEIPVGHVTRQEYEPGYIKKQGSVVGVWLSLGPRTVTVPDVRRLTRAEAENQLVQVGLRVGAVTEVFAQDVEAGRVAEQSPPPGTQVQEGAVVDLKISRGTRRVPNLVGRSLGEAPTHLANAGLTLGEVSRVQSPQPKDTVIGQDPKPDAEVPPGTRVNVTVSDGVPPPPVKETTVTIHLQPGSPEDRGYVNVRVLKFDAAGTEVLHEAPHLIGDSFVLPVRWVGDQAKLEVYINGQLRETIPLGTPPTAEAGETSKQSEGGGG